MYGEWVIPGYSHVRVLGEGSAGQVVLAVQNELDVPVAIKYLSPRLYDDHEFTDRFREEARLLAEIRDPHLVRFYEYVESRHGAAIVMELINGVSLAQLIESAGPTGPEAALSVLRGSLLGLTAAHLAGVVHRDYKPGNVLVRGDGVSKLADFGIAVRAGDDAPAAGSPAYMAPEQWRGSPVTPAADVYSATVVFYECLTGQRPYRATTLPELALAHRSRPIPAKHAPGPLRELIALGMAKEPGDRPASAAEFLDRLERTAEAAYGDGWERRGRAHLAELAALLALRLPSAKESGRGATALGLTELGRLGGLGRRIGQLGARRGLVAATAGTVAVLVAGGSVAVYAAGRGTDRPRRPLAGPSAPWGLSAVPSADPSAAPSGDPSGDPVDSPSPNPVAPVAEGPAPAGGIALPTIPADHGTIEEPRIRREPRGGPTPASGVTGIEIGSWNRDGRTGYGTFTVTTNGTGPITVLVSFTSNGKTAGPDQTMERHGARSYGLTADNTFETPCDEWTITVTGRPGNVSQSSTISAQKSCDTPGPGPDAVPREYPRAVR